MATTTFNKQFSVSKQKTEEFLQEMTKEIKPTLTNNFKSQLIKKSDLHFLKNIH